MRRIRICPATELPPGEMTRICDEHVGPIAIYRVGDEFFATADTCTHARSSLSEEGELEGAVVECGYHRARFDVRTGEVLSLPAREPLRTFAVCIDEGVVYVEVDAS